MVRSLVVLRSDNLVERPWGGTRLLAHKGLAARDTRAQRHFGEAFEAAADPTDAEAAAHPSFVLGDDGERMLSELLERDGDALLGDAFIRAHGRRLPLLPKTLDVAELLSVQAHPAGRPELYVVLDADEGATIRLGWRDEVDVSELEARIESALDAQSELTTLLEPRVDARDVQAALAPVLLRGADAEAAIGPLVRNTVYQPRALALVASLREACGHVLGLMHEIPVRAGDVIFNALPGADPNANPDATIHALGNPAGRAMMLLEIRLPGTTLRAWDHARFPPRAVDAPAALAAVGGRSVPAERFVVQPAAMAGHAGVERLAACGAFVVDRARLAPNAAVQLPGAGQVRTLQVTGGALQVRAGTERAELSRGGSVFVGVAAEGLEVTAADAGAELVQTIVPNS
jgi:mannose-6-phosphate isomerase class I